MTPFAATLVTLSIAAIAVVSILHALSATMLREIAIIDLRRETARLHAEHQRRLAELRRGQVEGVEILDQPGSAV